MNNKEATYTTFRDWLGLATIEEDTWSKIMEEDNCFDYANKGVGRDEIDVAGEIQLLQIMKMLMKMTMWMKIKV